MDLKRPSDVVPAPYDKIFSNIDMFNEMQASLLNDLLQTDKSIVLSAPTGSGKTVAFELAIVRMLLEDDRSTANKNDNNYLLPKVIYIAPIKALCSERYDDWMNRFNAVDIKCTQLTGDTHMANLMALQSAQIVISTPEKWDSLTRRRRDYKKLLPSVKLFIVDEVHLLNEDIRGPILEAIVARMKSSGVKRFFVASATIPNVQDLTSWIRSCNINALEYVFNETQRPVPLEKHVIGVNTNLKGFQFDMKLNYQLPEIMRKYAEGKATLVFCNSRKSAEMAASNLNKIHSLFQLSNQQKIYLNQLTQQLSDAKLKKLVENGIAYHHAGLQYADRNLIESSFRDGFLMVLLSTSTLAMGINLPAHLVVIKSTETYVHGKYVEYEENMLLQMIGRAGRPQYDIKGVVVILTQNGKVQKYKKLVNGKNPIESHLHKHLAEHLNSEISLNSINSLVDAMNWIRSTYLYVRSVRNPVHYGFPAETSKDLVEHKLEELSYKQINALENAGLVKINNAQGLNVETTAIGKLMAKYYLSFETMKKFRDIEGNESLENIFDLLVRSKELSEFTLRVNEKKILNELNKKPIRFPIKGRIKNTEEKISCIMQAVLGSLEITSASIIQESLKIFRIVERVSKCLLEYVRLCVQKRVLNNTENVWYKTVLSTFTAAKCIHAKLWENSEYASKQLNGIGAVYSTALVNAGKTTLKLIGRTDSRTIERILKKSAPFGDEVLSNLFKGFPEYEIKIVRLSDDFIEVNAKQVNESYVHKSTAVAALIVGDSLNNLLLLSENFDEICREHSNYFQRKIKIQKPKDVEYIYAHVIHTSLVGVDVHATLEINAPKINTQKVKKKNMKQTRIVKKLSDANDNTLNEEINENLDETLKNFQFKKPKLMHYHERTNDSLNDTTFERDIHNISLNINAELNDKRLMNDDHKNEFNTTKSSCITQCKITDYFVQRKKQNFATLTTQKTVNKESNSNQEPKSLIKLDELKEKPPAKETEKNLNFEKNKPLFTQHANNNFNNNFNPIKPTNKRQSIPNDLPSQNKKQKFENKKGAKSLESFLFDEEATMPTISHLIEKHNYQSNVNEHERKRKRERSPLIEMDTSNDMSQKKMKMNNPLNMSSFLGIEWKNIQSNNLPKPIPKQQVLFENKKQQKPSANNAINNNISDPTDEEFSLWYKVAMKFQKILPQSMSLKNFRHIYYKVRAKEKEFRKPELYELKIENENFLKPASRQIYRSEDMHNSYLADDTVNMINQDVMRSILDSKSQINTEAELIDIDEEMENAVKEIKELLNLSDDYL